ncbi:MAG: ATP-binding protein [Verrucomicrobiota bacterium]
MFRNLKIGTQIGFGIALILVVSALVATFAISGLKKSTANYTEYRSLAIESVRSGRVQANMLAAANAAQKFLNDREEDFALQFAERYALALDFALDQQALLQDSKRVEMSRQLVGSLEEYGRQTQNAFNLMRRRDAIVEQLLAPQGSRMQQNLTDLIAAAQDEDDFDLVYLTGRVMEHVMRGRFHLLRYLDESEIADALQVREEIDSRIQESYDQLVIAANDPASKSYLKDFSNARTIFLKAFDELTTLIDTQNNLIVGELQPLETSIADTAERIKLSLRDDQAELGPQLAADNTETVRNVIAGSILGAVLVIIIAGSVVRAISRPVSNLVKTIDEVNSSGDLATRLPIHGDNEIGAVAGTLNRFLGSLENKARSAQDVAAGKLNTQVELLSRNDTMGRALRDMIGTLKENEEEISTREWLHAGQEKLNDEMRGVLDHRELVSRILNTLARHLNAQQGAFFLFEEPSQSLHFAQGFALNDQKTTRTTFKIGEGMIGQAAEDKQPIVVDHIPEKFYQIASSLGETPPACLVSFPLCYNNLVLGVIELASVEPFTETKLEFFRAVQESICIALIAAQSQDELKSLLEQTQTQAIELADAQKTADAASKAKSDFLSNMSHELRTPLNGVLGYVQVLQRDQSLGPRQKESLEAINNCGAHLLNLINNILDLSKIEAGKLELAPKPTDLNQLIQGVRDIVKPRAESKGLHFRIKSSPEVPRGVVTDPIKLRQVLINLLGNSIKFTTAGSITLTVFRHDQESLRFDVEDTGMGISAAELSHIFEPFKQADGGENEGGTGLGLSISRRIAEALGGSLSASSEVGEGSCFSLTLPLEEAENFKGSDFTIATPESHASFCLPPGEKRSVLIADDRETNRDILNQILADAGFDTVVTTDGDEALEAIRKRPFDVFLCDIRMPRMDGLQVIKQIRQDNQLKHTIVLAVTADVFPEFRERALAAGFDDLIMKPLRVSELAQKLSKFLKVEFVTFNLSPNSAPTPGNDPAELFETLSEDKIEQITAAAKVRNFTRIGALAKSLLEEEETAAAGHHLLDLVAAFDVDGIKTIADTLNLTPATQDA